MNKTEHEQNRTEVHIAELIDIAIEVFIDICLFKMLILKLFIQQLILMAPRPLGPLRALSSLLRGEMHFPIGGIPVAFGSYSPTFRLLNSGYEIQTMCIFLNSHFRLSPDRSKLNRFIENRSWERFAQ